MLEIQQKKSNVRISTLDSSLEYTPRMHQSCMSTKSGVAIEHLSIAFEPPLQRKQYGRKSNNGLKLHWNCVYQLPVHSRIDLSWDIVTVQIASSQAPAGRKFLINSSKIRRNSYAPYDKFASRLMNQVCRCGAADSLLETIYARSCISPCMIQN